MKTDPLLDAAAANLAGWHDCSVRALGFAASAGRWWWLAPTPSPWIYFTAIELRHPASGRERRAARTELERHLEDPAGSFEAVCDSFGDLDLASLGLARRANGLWYARPPGAPPRLDPPPTGLAITEVTERTDLAAFEAATCAAFNAPPPVTPFDIHAPAILDDPAMHVLIARLASSERVGDGVGDVVAGAMAYVADGVVGIYGVGTVPGHRRSGYATALTNACVALAPDRPATLQPSAEAAALYRRLGFVEVGRFSHWG
jgi:ribosomal protein S18 acetylase RimI-like enzyme